MTAAQVDRVRRVFRSRAGTEPAGVWAAPGRANVIGDHTDYNGGFALPMAIDRRVVVAAGRREGDVVRAWSLQETEPASFTLSGVAADPPRGWVAYIAGAVWGLRGSGVDVGAFDLVLDGAVPAGSGLASSAAVECATALALADLHGARVDRVSLARAARRGEVEIVGVPVGVMDQMAALCCREGHALFLDTRSLSIEQVPFDLPRAGLALVVVDAGTPHRLVEGEYAKRKADCEVAARALGVRALRDVELRDVERGSLEPRIRRRARHVVNEDRRVLDVVSLLRQGRHADIGPLLTASHISLRDDYEVSTRELDAVVEASLDAGALGARMTGAGFGGCAIALVATDRVPELRHSIRDRFASNGDRDPDVFPVVAATGAGRLT
jgi:galactokinase